MIKSFVIICSKKDFFIQVIKFKIIKGNKIQNVYSYIYLINDK